MTSLPASSPVFTGDFRTSFTRLVAPPSVARVFSLMGPRGAGTPKLNHFDWLMSLVYHALAGAGTFAHHVLMLTGVTLSDAALSQRKASFGWELLSTLLPDVLRPLADPALHPDCFHKGLRLAALDGVRFHLRNTGAINAGTRKARSGKDGSPCAYAWMLCSVLVELGTHCPLAVSLSWQDDGELTLARDIIPAIPGSALLLADRLYGSPWLLWELGPALQQNGSHFLVRVKDNLKVQRQRRLDDGSWLVSVAVTDPSTGKKTGSLILREIHATMHVESEATPRTVRLWTSLLDAAEHPALVLVGLYTTRWEEELFFRELKTHVHGADSLLHAQTVESAAMEVMALLLAAAVLAGQRLGVAAEAGVPALKISLAQVREQSLALFEILEAGRGLLSRAQQAEITRRVLLRLTLTALIKPRKKRSCQRALRQPIKSWPKMRTPTSRYPVVKIIITGLNP